MLKEFLLNFTFKGWLSSSYWKERLRRKLIGTKVLHLPHRLRNFWIEISDLKPIGEPMCSNQHFLWVIILVCVLRVNAQSESLRQRELADVLFVRVPGGEMRCEIQRPTLTQVDLIDKNVAVSSFWMAATEVTVGEFKRFCDATSYVTQAESGEVTASGYVPEYHPTPKRPYPLTWKDPGFVQSEDYPVTCITFQDAKEYCRWLTKIYGHSFRLPNVEEWQYAYRWEALAQAEIALKDTDYVNLADRSLGDFEKKTDERLGRPPKIHYRNTEMNDGFAFAAPVRAKKAGKNGLHFLRGNVSELCELNSEFDPESDVRFANPPIVVCGESWLSDFKKDSPGIIFLHVAEFASNIVGFRLVCTPVNE